MLAAPQGSAGGGAYEGSAPAVDGLAARSEHDPSNPGVDQGLYSRGGDDGSYSERDRLIDEFLLEEPRGGRGVSTAGEALYDRPIEGEAAGDRRAATEADAARPDAAEPRGRSNVAMGPTLDGRASVSANWMNQPVASAQGAADGVATQAGPSAIQHPYYTQTGGEGTPSPAWFQGGEGLSPPYPPYGGEGNAAAFGGEGLDWPGAAVATARGVFGTSWEALWFEPNARHLEIGIAAGSAPASTGGRPGEVAHLPDGYGGSAGALLLQNQVDQLIGAMAVFEPTSGDSADLAAADETRHDARTTIVTPVEF